MGVHVEKKAMLIFGSILLHLLMNEHGMIGAKPHT